MDGVKIRLEEANPFDLGVNVLEIVLLFLGFAADPEAHHQGTAQSPEEESGGEAGHGTQRFLVRAAGHRRVACETIIHDAPLGRGGGDQKNEKHGDGDRSCRCPARTRFLF